jgi:uncharacterized protein YkuJ
VGRERERADWDSLALVAVEVFRMNHLKFVDNMVTLDWKTVGGGGVYKKQGYNLEREGGHYATHLHFWQNFLFPPLKSALHFLHRGLDQVEYLL